MYWVIIQVAFSLLSSRAQKVTSNNKMIKIKLSVYVTVENTYYSLINYFLRNFLYVFVVFFIT